MMSMSCSIDKPSRSLWIRNFCLFVALYGYIKACWPNFLRGKNENLSNTYPTGFVNVRQILQLSSVFFITGEQSKMSFIVDIIYMFYFVFNMSWMLLWTSQIAPDEKPNDSVRRQSHNFKELVSPTISVTTLYFNRMIIKCFDPLLFSIKTPLECKQVGRDSSTLDLLHSHS